MSGRRQDTLASEIVERLTGATISGARPIERRLGAPTGIEVALANGDVLRIDGPGGVVGVSDGVRLDLHALVECLDREDAILGIVLAGDRPNLPPGNPAIAVVVERIELHLHGGGRLVISTVDGEHVLIGVQKRLASIQAGELAERLRSVRIAAAEVVSHPQFDDAVSVLLLELESRGVVTIAARILGAGTDGHAQLLFADDGAGQMPGEVHAGDWIVDRLSGMRVDDVLVVRDPATDETTGLIFIEADRRVVIDVEPTHAGAQGALAIMASRIPGRTDADGSAT